MDPHRDTFFRDIGANPFKNTCQTRRHRVFFRFIGIVVVLAVAFTVLLVAGFVVIKFVI